MTRTISEEHDVAFLPKPNAISLVLAEDLPPLELISSSLGLVFSDEGFLMTNLRLRGWDIPGGHVEPDESPAEAMVREVREETGLEVRAVALVGYQCIRIDGPVPDDYRYPVPESFQTFFLAVPVHDHGLVATTETNGARFWPLTEAREQSWVKNHRELFEVARAAAHRITRR